MIYSCSTLSLTISTVIGLDWVLLTHAEGFFWWIYFSNACCKIILSGGREVRTLNLHRKQAMWHLGPRGGRVCFNRRSDKTSSSALLLCYKALCSWLKVFDQSAAFASNAKYQTLAGAFHSATHCSSPLFLEQNVISHNWNSRFFMPLFPLFSKVRFRVFGRCYTSDRRSRREKCWATVFSNGVQCGLHFFLDAQRWETVYPTTADIRSAIHGVIAEPL